MKSCCALVALLLVIFTDNSLSDSRLRLCHGLECPQEAVSCTKSFKASGDNKKLITTYNCDGLEGKVLLTKTNEENNPQYDTKVHQPYTITKQFLVI